MSQKLILIRQLPGCDPVAMAVIDESNDPDVDCQISYMRGKAEDIIEDFCNKFVEFKTANFYMSIVDNTI